MTDLEIVKKCAERMGIAIMEPLAVQQAFGCDGFVTEDNWEIKYDPLHNDAQAMAMVKKFGLGIYFEPDGWGCFKFKEGGPNPDIFNKDLNRAICECVANLPEES